MKSLKVSVVFVLSVGSALSLAQNNSNQSDVTGIGTQDLVPVVIPLPAPKPGDPPGPMEKTVTMTRGEAEKYGRGAPGDSIDFSSSAELAGGPETLAPDMIGCFESAELLALIEPSGPCSAAETQAREAINEQITLVRKAIANLNNVRATLPARDGKPVAPKLNRCRQALAKVYAAIHPLISEIDKFYAANPDSNLTLFQQVGDTVTSLEEVVANLETANLRFDLLRNIYHKIT